MIKLCVIIFVRKEDFMTTDRNKLCAGLGVSYADIMEYIPQEQDCIDAKEEA